MKLKYIRFILENCDEIEIDGKYVGDFLVDDVRNQICRIASNSIDEMNIANIFAIEIHKDANVERYQFGQTNMEDYKQMTFDRFTACDITQIEFELEEIYVEDGKEPYVKDYHYYVDWNGNDECYNETQVNYISKDGHLYIVIAKDKSIEDFFDLEEINDEDCMDFKFEMYGAGNANSADVIADEMFDEIYKNIMGEEEF